VGGEKGLDDVPDLVHVVVRALPHLSRSTRVGVPIRQIETLALVRPLDLFGTGDGILLVRVSGITGVDLHLDAVGGGAVGDVETLVSVNLNSPAGNSPRLRSRLITGLNDDRCVVRVTGSRQTLARRLAGFDLVAFSRRGSDSVDDGPLLVLAAGAVPDLGRIPGIGLPIGIIQTLVRASEPNRSRTRRSPLLILVAAATSPDLHLLAIGRNTVRVVQTFVAEDLEGATGDGPELTGRDGIGARGAVLDDDCPAVGVGSRTETFGIVAVGVDDFLRGGRRGGECRSH